MPSRTPSLAGLGVLVTRPAHQAEGLCDALQARGAVPLRYPLLSIEAVSDPAGFAALAARLTSFDIVFFVSPNAVTHGLSGLRAYCAWPEHLRVATVGAGSARCLREQGFDDLIFPQQGFDSEAVLALSAFQEKCISGKSVLVLRGDGGRPLLADTLRQRGAEVEFFTCYHRSCPQQDFAPVHGWLDDASLHVLTVSSSEALHNLVRLAGADGLARVAGLPLLASHPRIAAFARAAGFRNVLETAPGDEGVLLALESQHSMSLS